ncbi:MAG TPA: hypothetical protein VHZ97_18760 [Pseudonocardiaceae bacterium]|nr:hypothetical protein [Pseudonocardiaceae bacterium]
MNATPDTQLDATERIRADYTQVRKLGNWTTARSFAVRARRGHVVLDLRSPRIPDGDIDITVDFDHAMLKLLLPNGAVVDDEDLRWTGRGRIKDYQGQADAPRGRTVRISGAIRHGEIRVNRDGVAMLSAMFTKEYVRDVLAAHREGRYPTIDDPTREH